MLEKLTDREIETERKNFIERMQADAPITIEDDNYIIQVGGGQEIFPTKVLSAEPEEVIRNGNIVCATAGQKFLADRAFRKTFNIETPHPQTDQELAEKLGKQYKELGVEGRQDSTRRQLTGALLARSFYEKCFQEAKALKQSLEGREGGRGVSDDD